MSGVLGDGTSGSGATGSGAGQGGAGTGGTAGGGTGGAGAGAQGGAGAGAEGGQATWRDSLPTEMRDDPSLAVFSDLPSFAKSYLYTKSMVGKKGVVVPGEKATDEEWATFYKSVGQPEIDKFEMALPKDKPVNEKFVTDFKQVAHKAGLLPRQAQGLIDWYIKTEGDGVAASQAQKNAQITQGIGELKKEWGQGYDRQLQIGDLALKEVGGQEVIDWAVKNGLTKDPQFIKFANKVGKLLGEDKIRGEGGSGRMGDKTPAEIQKQIDSVMGNPSHPYFDSTHPGHRTAVNEMEGFFQSLHTS